MAIQLGYEFVEGKFKVKQIPWLSELDETSGYLIPRVHVDGISFEGEILVDLRATSGTFLTLDFGDIDNIAIIGLYDNAGTGELKPIAVDVNGKLVMSAGLEVDLTGPADTVWLQNSTGVVNAANPLPTEDQGTIYGDGTNYLMSLNSVTRTKISPNTGTKTVTAAGTAEPLVAAETFCRKVLLEGMKDNSGLIYFGGSTVDNTNGKVFGKKDALLLEAVLDENIDLHELFIDSDNNDEGMTFTYWS